jgi:hypothetical protein
VAVIRGPGRLTVAVVPTIACRRSAAWNERNSWTNRRPTLIKTITAMMTAAFRSPVRNDTMASVISR